MASETAREQWPVLRLAIVAASCAAVATAHAAPAGAATEGDVALARAHEKQVPLSRADRRAINALLDVFVATAVERRDPEAAYDLATPALRGGSTRRMWARGDIPVMPYRAAGTRFHEWTLAYSFRNEVLIPLTLRPERRQPGGAILFEVALARVGGRWRVDGFMPAATFARGDEPARMWAVPDVNAPGGGPEPGRPRLSAVWFAVPAVLLGLPVVVALAFAARGTLAARRARAERW